jgi:hypothetical protein
MATIAILLITSVGIGGFGGYAEKVLLPDVMPDQAKFLLDPSPNVPGGKRSPATQLVPARAYPYSPHAQ